MADLWGQFQPLLPQLILLGAALALPALDWVFKEKRYLAAVALGALVLVAALETLLLFPQTIGSMAFLLPPNLLSTPSLSTQLSAGFQLFPTAESGPGAMGLLVLSTFSVGFTLVFLAVGILAILASPRSISGEKNHGEYYALLLGSILGMTIVALAGDLFVLFVGLELSSLSTFALAGFFKRQTASAEAATKYFIIGGFSSAVTLYGISLLYGALGTTRIPGVADAVGSPGGLGALTTVGLVFLIAGIGFKITAVPFHAWAPDVYEGAPTPISAFLAAGSKKMGFAAYFKVFLVALLAVKADWDLALGALAILTMTVGNLLAIPQTNIKRMLAYSSIAQAGYILIALPVQAHVAPTDTPIGLAGGVIHILTHAFMKGGAFFVVAALATVGVGESLQSYSGLRTRSPFLAFAMAIFLLSLAGIPPLAGFASKFYLFSSAVKVTLNGPDWLVWLAIAGVLNSALSLYYYARILRYMYVVPAEKDAPRLRPSPSVVAAVAGALIATIVIGLYPGPFFQFAEAVAGGLVG